MPIIALDALLGVLAIADRLRAADHDDDGDLDDRQDAGSGIQDGPVARPGRRLAHARRPSRDVCLLKLEVNFGR